MKINDLCRVGASIHHTVEYSLKQMVNDFLSRVHINFKKLKWLNIALQTSRAGHCRAGFFLRAPTFRV